MTEHFKGEAKLRNDVRTAVKQHMLDSKVQNTEITFGQAVVTHHLMANPIEFKAAKPLFSVGENRANSP